MKKHKSNRSSRNSNPLAERAMLVHLRISSWTASSRDERVRKDVCSKNRSEKDAGEWYTKLVPPKELAAVNKARMRCRAVYFEHTLPWMDGSMRILSSDLYLAYTKKIREALAEYNKEVAAFLQRYPKIAAGAERRLGKLIEGHRLPSVQEVGDKFYVVHDILPIQDETDFRCKLAAEDVTEVRQRIQDSISTMTDRAMTDIWQQLQELVGKVATTLSKPDKVFRDSLITNLQKFCTMIPKMNIGNSKDLEEMRLGVLTTLGKVSPNSLRKESKTRRKIGRQAKEISEKLESILAARKPRL